jgi:hypothetical protein
MDFNEVDLSKPGVGAKTSVATEPAPTAVQSAEATEAQPKTKSAVVSNAREVLEHAVTEVVTEKLHKRDVASIAPDLTTPVALGVRNSEIAAAVKEAVAAAMSAIVPALERINAPTPLEQEQSEQIARNRARAKREAAQMKIQDEENRANLQAKQKTCSHLDQNSKEALQLNRNWPDRQPRAICARCNLLVFPKQYICPAPPMSLEDAVKYSVLLQREGYRDITPYQDPKTKQVTHFLVGEHELYHRVREMLVREGTALAG